MDFVTSDIAIGNVHDARAVTDEVDGILCLRPRCDCDEREDLEALHVPLVDGPGNPRRKVDECVAYLRASRACGDRILVHCQAGRSRSVAIVARFLVVEDGLSAAAALAHIRARREAWLTPGIEDILAGGR